MTKEERILIFAISLCVAIVLGAIFSQLNVATQTVTIIKRTISLSYLPPPSQFGLTNSTGTILSNTAGEESLLDYSYPIADIDMMLNYYAQEIVILPGKSYDRYYYYGTIYVPGSGWVEKWRAPNGGRFALLHMSRVNVQTLPTVSSPKKIKFLPHIDNTANAYSQLVAANLIANSGYYTGGTAVGYSGWPIWAQYGNGLAGPFNAHLCLLVDQAALNWFNYVEYRRPPAPKPFNFALWYKWTKSHHKKAISPYYGHKLSAIATYWWHHAENKCKSVTHQWTYNKKQKFTKQTFERCNIYSWNNHRLKLQITL